MKESPEIHFTPEQELLLWSIRVDHTKDQRIEEILKDGVDWNYVRETAIQHGVFPLLYKRLKEEMSHLVPSNEIEELRTLFMANAVQNLRMTQQLIKVLDLLANAGIEAMPFKGPALAVQAYGDLAMRSFCDLDILIHENDIEKSCDILKLNGDISIKKYYIKNILKSGKELHLSSNNYNIDIHWKIIERYRIVHLNTERLWAQANSIIINGHKVKTISSEDVVIILCIHGTKHSWKELKLLTDLIFFIDHNSDLNWNAIFTQAEKFGLRRIVALGLNLAREFGGVVTPSTNNYYSTRSDKVLKKLAFIVKKNYFHQMKDTFNLSSSLFFMKSRERVMDKITFIFFYIHDAILAPNKNDFDFFYLPEFLFPLYYMVRPIRILKQKLILM